jgi:L-amino acid N-acyltransferase YncA
LVASSTLLRLNPPGEYTILLRSDLKGTGLGWALMQLIIEYAKSEGLKQVLGEILQGKVPGIGI